MTKKEALSHLKSRRIVFLNLGKFGTAELMLDIYNAIKDKPESYDFSGVKYVGLFFGD